ncbi:MAG: hypothetical protein JWL90_3419, partial [Chthoniobacteraceae bacterium]|nr:hypothetical protein [Chthoniobacteraceae bacterium]
EDLEVLSFRLGGKQFAVSLVHVREIIRVPRITRVPLAPAYVLGLLNLRGEVITVISGSARVGLTSAPSTLECRILILTIEQTKLGVVVDEVDRILRFTPDQFDTSVDALTNMPAEFVAGVLKYNNRTIFKLAAVKLLDQKEESAPAVAAMALSAPRPVREAVSTQTVVIAEIGREEFGIAIGLVREVVRFVEPNPIPDAPAFLLGVMMLRSQVLPVIELRTLMQRPSFLEEIRRQIAPVRAAYENARIDKDGMGAALLEKSSRLIEASALLLPRAEKLLTRTAILGKELRGSASGDHSEAFAELFALLDAIVQTAIEAPDRRLLIVESEGARFGLAVDRVTQIVAFPKSALQPPPPIANESGVHLAGLVPIEGSKRLVLLLQLEEMIRKNRLQGASMNEPQSDRLMLASNQEQWVSFLTGGEEFALPISEVFEIGRVETITRIPSAPKFIQGVINLRGEIVPVIDLRKRFGLEALAATNRTRILYFQTGVVKVGLIVDGVSQILSLAPSDFTPPPPSICSKRVLEYLSGIAHYKDRMILLLNSESLLTKAEQQGAEKTSRAKLLPAPEKPTS